MLNSGSPPSSAICPSAGRIRPAIMRSKELLPAPFGPVNTSALPVVMEKLTPQNTWRPPRMQVNRSPANFIATTLHTLASAALAVTFRRQFGRVRAFGAAPLLPLLARVERVGGPFREPCGKAPSSGICAKSAQISTSPREPGDLGAVAKCRGPALAQRARRLHAFFPRSLVQNYRSYGRTAKKSV